MCVLRDEVRVAGGCSVRGDYDLLKVVVVGSDDTDERFCCHVRRDGAAYKWRDNTVIVPLVALSATVLLVVNLQQRKQWH